MNIRLLAGRILPSSSMEKPSFQRTISYRHAITRWLFIPGVVEQRSEIPIPSCLMSIQGDPFVRIHRRFNQLRKKVGLIESETLSEQHLVILNVFFGMFSRFRVCRCSTYFDIMYAASVDTRFVRTFLV